MSRYFADDAYNPIPAEYTAAVEPPSYVPPPPPPDGAYTGPGSSYWNGDNSTQSSNSEPSVVQVSQDSAGVQGAVPANGSSTDWTSLFTGVGKGLVNIFGQKVGGQQAPIVKAPTPAVPVWVWVAAPIVVIGLLAVLIRSARRPAMAEYRKRRSRRSRR